MRRIITILYLCLSSIFNLAAQLNVEVLMDCYGGIRAEMTRTACEIAEFKNETTINLINNESLKNFKAALAYQNTWTHFLKIVKESDRSLTGTDIDKYHEDILAILQNYELKLLKNYSEKQEVVQESFGKYRKKISDLTEECNFFNCDKENNYRNYLKKYGHGHFVKLAQEQVDVVKSGTGFFHAPYWEYVVIAFIIVILSLFIRKNLKLILGTLGRLLWKLMIKMGIVNELRILIEGLLEDKKSKPEIRANKHFVDSDKNSSSQQHDEKLTKGSEKKSSVSLQTKSGITTDIAGGMLDDIKAQSSISPKEINAFADDSGEWGVIGASVQGNGHIETNTPCQDNHKYESLTDGWGIAILSDGAGSAVNSHIGSAIIVNRAMIHFKKLIEKEEWIEKKELPTQARWTKLSYQILKLVYDEIKSFAEKNKYSLKSLSATVIVVIHSPMGLLVTHVGDGRAGYKSMNGEWHSMITPHKGEEANQTIFLTSEFWNIPFFEMSGVMVPEACVIGEKVRAYTLMSDGCENTSWLCNQYDGSTGKYYDPNLPFDKFFDSLIHTLQTFHSENMSLEDRKTKWYNFIMEGNQSFVKEVDDKTMILGVFHL